MSTVTLKDFKLSSYWNILNIDMEYPEHWNPEH